MFFEVNNLYFSYYKSPMTVRGAKFAFDKNSKVLLLASNEMGKTTMLKVLSGFDETYMGSIKLNGKELKDIDDNEKRFSLLLDSPVLFQRKSIKYNIDFLCETLGIEKLSDEKLKQLLDEFKIERESKCKVSKLSLFEKRKLAILRSTIKNSSIIFLDDQFDEMPEESQQDLEEIYKKILSQSSAVVMALSGVSFKNHQNFVKNIKFDKVLYLCDAELFVFSSVNEFSESLVRKNIFNFVDGFFKLNGFIFKVDDKYYFCEEDKREIELDKSFYLGLNELKLENGEHDRVNLFSKSKIDLENITDNEFNKKLKSREFLMYSNLDGKKLF